MKQSVFMETIGKVRQRSLQARLLLILDQQAGVDLPMAPHPDPWFTLAA